MGKKSGGSTPNVVAAADIEGQYSTDAIRNQAYAANADQNGPLGSSQWSQEVVIDPASGEEVTKWVNNQTLSPAMQAQFDLENETNTRLGITAGLNNDRIQADMGAPLNWEQFGQGKEGPAATNTSAGSRMNATSTNPNERVNSAGPVGANLNATTGNEQFNWSSDNRGRAEDAAYARSTKRLDPRFAKERSATETRLANRGLRAGDAAYDAEMSTFGTTKNDAYEMARLGATSEGRAEDSQSYGQAQGAFGTNRATEQQRFGQNREGNINARSADAQNFGQKMGANAQDFSQRSTADQQNFGRELSADQQNFNKNLAANNQNFAQGSQATNRSNALRSQNIEEYLGKRGQSLKEQNALRASQTTGETISNFGSGG